MFRRVVSVLGLVSAGVLLPLLASVSAGPAPTASARAAASKPASMPTTSAKPTSGTKPAASAKPAGGAKAEPNQPAETGVAVLDTQSSWRMHNTLEAPVIQLADRLLTVPAGYVLGHVTEPPPADWAKVDFDDSGWPRDAASRSARTQCLSRLCLRGRFTVSDPAKVDSLRLNVDFRGGAIVYLNGKEIHRSHVPATPKGQAAPATVPSAGVLADAYPVEAFVGPGGKLLGDEGRDRDAESVRRYALRTRSIRDFAVPKDALVKGLNLLAIELVRAPYDKAIEENKAAGGRGGIYDLNWHTCELARIDLRAASDAGLTPNVARPKGFQIWNADLLAGDFDIQFGEATEALRPIAISGARGGWFSGKVLVGCDQPIRGLKATASELKGAAGTIPASEVRVRYGFAWGREQLTLHHVSQAPVYPRAPAQFGAISDQPLAEYAVAQPPARPAGSPPRAPTNERPGAVVPVWITVHIPATAAPGEYAGTLTIQAEGLPPRAVPVSLKVIGWTLPDPQDYRTWVELIQVPDTLSVEYDVPLWSVKHRELIAQSMDYAKDIGSRVVYVPLIAQNNLGNAESMVRWNPKLADTATPGASDYTYDFSTMETYLDLAEKHMGKPKLVIFEVWEVYMIPTGVTRPDVKEGGQPKATVDYRKERNLQWSGPVVTVQDSAGGKTRSVTLPSYVDANGKASWGPLLSEIRKRMQARGLEGAMAFGTISDYPPSKDEISFFHDLAPEVPWVIHSHHGGGALYGGLGKVVYATRVWNNDFPTGDPEKGRSHGWQSKFLIANYQREGSVMEFPQTAWHNMAEMNIAGGQRGVGRLGLDFWAAVRDKNGVRKGAVAARYPQSSRRNLDLYTSLLAPGPAGPVATTRLEAFRQGVEECEARIVIDQALVDPAARAKLGDELARRCQASLDERSWCTIKGMSAMQLRAPGWLWGCWYDLEAPAGNIWYLGSDWQKRAEELFTLAGQVQQKLGAK